MGGAVPRDPRGPDRRGPSAIPAILASVILPGPVVRLVSAKPAAADLDRLIRLADESRLVPLVEQSYPLRDIAAAHRDAEGRSASGKRVIVASSTARDESP